MTSKSFEPPIRVFVIGASGRMGRAVMEAVGEARDLELCGASSRGEDLPRALAAARPQVCVEFTVAEAAEQNLRTALRQGAHVVSGTTGLAAGVVRALGEEAGRAGLGLVLAPNFAIGAVLLQRFAREAARFMPDVEILEMHHERKRDAPSGTAWRTAELIAEASPRALQAADREEHELLPGARGASVDGIRIHSVRLPGLLAHQEVLFGLPGQTLSLRHDTLDRRAFMPGVLLAIRRVVGHRGLVTSLEEFLDPTSP